MNKDELSEAQSDLMIVCSAASIAVMADGVLLDEDDPHAAQAIAAAMGVIDELGGFDRVAEAVGRLANAFGISREVWNPARARP